MDVIIRDGEVVAIEAESYAEEEDVDALALKTRYLERILGKRVAKAYIVAVNISKEALKRAKELGIEAISGNTVG